MTIITASAHVDEQGNVTMPLPEPFRQQGRTVRVTLGTPETPPPLPTQAEWVALLDRTAGSMPTLTRPPQPAVGPAPEFE